MKSIYLLIACFTFYNSYGQDCEVLKPELKGKYTGECNNGKAEGKGRAEGEDVYEGQFKKGYPDGQGIYWWKNGNSYSGLFKKGMKDGRGFIHFKLSADTDSTVSGFWKKDKYIGEYESAYVVYSSSSLINKVNAMMIRKGNDNITLTIHTVTGGPITLTGINVLTGTYNGKSDQSMGTTAISYLQQVQFPFRASFYFSNGAIADILINEKADWDIEIEMLK